MTLRVNRVSRPISGVVIAIIVACGAPIAAGKTASVSKPEVIRLWPGVPPGGSLAKTPERTFAQHVDWKDQMVTISVSDPTLTVLRPPPGKATGTAMVVAPGGGFISLVWDLEGTEIADWLTARGVTVFVLKYRVSLPGPDGVKPGDTTQPARTLEVRRSHAVADAAQAISLIRDGAARWAVDPKRVGMIGFSAGAYTTMGVVLEGNARQRPDFAASIYGGAKLDDVQVTADAPPLFIVHAQDDPLVSPTASTAMFDAWQKAKRPAELHIYEKGGHGFGMRSQGLPVDRWPADFETWLASRGLIRPITPPVRRATGNAHRARPTVHLPVHYSIEATEVGVLIDNPVTRAILDKQIPGLATSPQITAARSLTLKEIQSFAPNLVTDQRLAAIEAELNKL
jgi:acetyl esterase/lipase